MPFPPHYSKRKADAIANGFFLILIGILFYTDQWWPGILFAIGISLGIRQYLTGRRFDLFVTIFSIGILTLVIIAGSFLSNFFPILFVAAGLYLIGRETLLFKKFSKKFSKNFSKNGRAQKKIKKFH